MRYNCVVVCGPTACGKTGIGVRIADRYDGEIISADSRQVYRGMDIGSGKDLAEYHFMGRNIPYHCIDIAEPCEIYTLYRYRSDFNRAFLEITGKARLPVIVGGTGLYIEAALKQYEIPHAPEDVEFRKKMMELDHSVLAGMLESKSPELYRRTDLSSRKRIVRALEIAESEVAGAQHDFIEIRPLVFGIQYPRDEVKRRIDIRLEARLAEGMVEEVKALVDSGVSRDRMIMFGMEYSRIARYLYGETTYEEMKENLRTDIHRLSKRQMTWFRGMERRGIHICWIENGGLDAIFRIMDSEFPLWSA